MEEIEIPQVGVDSAAEHAHEKSHHMGHQVPWLRWLALTTAILAVLAAVASLKSGHYANEALSAMTESTLKQAQASDQWELYQAKGVKMAVREVEAEMLEAQGKSPEIVKLCREKVTKYTDEQKEISNEAKAKETERDEKLKEADKFFEVHHHFAYSVTLLQVAIGLCAMAAIIERKEIYLFGLAVGLGGFVLFFMALFQ